MTWSAYRAWLDEWERFVASLPPRKGGIATPVDKTLGRTGRRLTQLLLEALDSNRITAVDASRFLDLRFGHFEGVARRTGCERQRTCCDISGTWLTMYSLDDPLMPK